MIPANEFGRTLVAAGLASADEVKAAWSELPADQKQQGATALAASLLSAGKLTPYQSEELLAGRGKSLVLGNYLVLDRIGAGGMGQVFRARHRRMERLVAIKLLPPAFSQDEAMIKRFQREVHAAAKLTHPNIVVAYDADQTPDGVHFLVMEYVDGCDLAALVKRQGPLAVSVAADYVLQAARGLAFAHAEGVIHRDIKPANLLLDKKGTVKILDMGLARLDGASVEGEGLTQSGQVMGTIDYMAPEQALNTRLADARADIYSLGCTLYRLLVGESPYGGETMMEKLLAHREQPIPSLRARRLDVPTPLEAIYTNMMAKEASDRYQTMTEVTTALEQLRASPVRSPSASDGRTADPDSKLSAFMQTMSLQTATQKKTRGASTKAAGGVEATVSFQSVEVGTDPKSELILPQSLQVGRSNGPPRGSNRRLLAAGGGALALVVLLGVWLVVRDKDGKETGRIELPDGGSLSVESGDAGKTKSKAKTPTPRPTNSSTPPPLAVAPFTAAEAKKHQSAWAAHLGVEVTEDNSLGMKMTLIPPGEFLMGTSGEELAAALKIAEETKLDENSMKRVSNDQRPQHRVRLTQAFRLCAHEVTIGQFAKFVEQSGYKTQAEEFGGTSGAEKLDDTAQLAVNWRTPGYAVDDSSPVTQVTWNDAVVFCNWLSEQEEFSPCYRRDGNTWTLIPKTVGYRLPTEAEWEYACRAGTTTQYWFGNDWREQENYGWSNKNAGGRARAVGLLPGNAWNLHDMSGNVWEWCHDWFDGKFYGRSPENDPVGPSGASLRVDRGGGWLDSPALGRSASRNIFTPAPRHSHRGFRPALSSVGAKPSTPAIAPVPAKTTVATANPAVPSSGTAPEPAVAPFTDVEAKKHQSAWASHLGVEVTEDNSLGMTMTLIPPGEFLMGTSDEELAVALKIAEETKLDENSAKRIQEERPQHRVRLTQAFRLCAHEVTIGQFAKFIEHSGYKTQAEEFGFGNSSSEKLDDKVTPQQKEMTWKTPGYAVADDSPVTQVTWNDAVVFCNWLSEQEKFTPCYRRDGNTWKLIPKTAGYRLPTEAEWEYACRAGTTTQYWFGDDWREQENYGWSNQNAGGRARAVGLLPGNAWNLHDMSGNVWEWCHDWYDVNFYGRSPEDDPVGPSGASPRVFRGGGWYGTPAHGRSAFRSGNTPADRVNSRGFRPALRRCTIITCRTAIASSGTNLTCFGDAGCSVD